MKKKTTCTSYGGLTLSYLFTLLLNVFICTISLFLPLPCALNLDTTRKRVGDNEKIDR